MRIDDKNLSSAAAAGLGRTQGTEQSKQATHRGALGEAGIPGQGDQVQLSNLAETVQSLEPGSAAAKARLDELAKLVAGGKYSPDAGVVADKLIDDSIETKPSGGPQ